MKISYINDFESEVVKMLQFEDGLLQEFQKQDTEKCRIMQGYIQGKTLREMKEQGFKSTSLKILRTYAYDLALGPEHVLTIYVNGFHVTNKKDVFYCLNGNLNDYDGESVILWQIDDIGKFHRRIHNFLAVFDPYPSSKYQLTRGRFLANDRNIIVCDLSYEDFVNQIIKLGKYERNQIIRRVQNPFS